MLKSNAAANDETGALFLNWLSTSSIDGHSYQGPDVSKTMLFFHGIYYNRGLVSSWEN
ncbi:MAG: hypothetical protein ACTSVI_13675 [Promethearchaeota archaeon]